MSVDILGSRDNPLHADSFATIVECILVLELTPRALNKKAHANKHTRGNIIEIFSLHYYVGLFCSISTEREDVVVVVLLMSREERFLFFDDVSCV